MIFSSERILGTELLYHYFIIQNVKKMIWSGEEGSDSTNYKTCILLCHFVYLWNQNNDKCIFLNLKNDLIVMMQFWYSNTTRTQVLTGCLLCKNETILNVAQSTAHRSCWYQRSEGYKLHDPQRKQVETPKQTQHRHRVCYRVLLVVTWKLNTISKQTNNKQVPGAERQKRLIKTSTQVKPVWSIREVQSKFQVLCCQQGLFISGCV